MAPQEEKGSMREKNSAQMYLTWSVESVSSPLLLYTFSSFSVHLSLPTCTQIAIWGSLISSGADASIWAS